jgi:3-oxoacyl-[acyl-carrier protein] reductase
MTMKKDRFSGKHVLVTGAAQGIGFEIARQFALEGARLSLLDNKDVILAQAQAQLAALGANVQGYLTDVSVRQQVEDSVSEAENIQPIDVLINNAGIAAETPFLEIADEEWNRILAVNLTGMFFVAQAVSRKMVARKRGTIVNMGSKNGLDGEWGYAHYNASKGGVVMLTKTMALELAHLGIRVNAVCPGYIQTPMSAEIDAPEFTQRFVERYIPMNRAGKVEEIAPLFLFLAGEESSFMTGQILIADGGQLAGQKPGEELWSRGR